MRTAKTDQTGRMTRLIQVFAGRTCHFVGFVMRRLIFVSFPHSSLLIIHSDMGKYITPQAMEIVFRLNEGKYTLVFPEDRNCILSHSIISAFKISYLPNEPKLRKHTIDGEYAKRYNSLDPKVQ